MFAPFQRIERTRFSELTSEQIERLIALTSVNAEFEDFDPGYGDAVILDSDSEYWRNLIEENCPLHMELATFRGRQVPVLVPDYSGPMLSDSRYAEIAPRLSPIILDPEQIFIWEEVSPRD